MKYVISLISFFSLIGLPALAQDASPCDWMIGDWSCLEASTGQNRKFSVRSEELNQWRMTMYDEGLPDPASDEWVTHRIGNRIDVGAGMRETTACSGDGVFSMRRMFSLFGTASMKVSRVSENEMEIQNGVKQAGTDGFSETYSCRR